MMIASKGAAGVSGAGIAVLAGGLSAHRPDLVDGVGLIVGIDRFMSEARALTNFSGNAVATILLGKWVGEFDPEQAQRVLSGDEPFDEATMIDDDEPPELAEHPALGHETDRHGQTATLLLSATRADSSSSSPAEPDVHRSPTS